MQDKTPVVGAPDPAAEVSKMAELNRLSERLMDGDFSRQTWVDLWVVLGQPLVLAIILILAVLFLSGWVGRMSTGALRRARVEETLARFFGNAARWGLLVLGGLAVINTLGVDTTSFAAVVAATGFAIGLAMSGMLSNFAAGIMLLVFRPFKVGDVVSAAGVLGTIDEIGMFTTEFDTFDMRRITVPNGKLFGDIIENVTHHPVRRVEVAVGTDYSADVEATREVLERMARSVQGVRADPAPQVFLSDLGGSSVNWKVRVWADNKDYWDMHQRLVRDTKRALDGAGIGIPFAQTDMHLAGPVEVRVLDGRRGE